MTTAPPPFDPPYVSVHRTENGIHYLETLADGKTRPVPASAIGSIWPCNGEADGMVSRTEIKAQTSANKGATESVSSQSGSNRTAVFMKVPFADKDAAKALGARWNRARKKWYVPHGVDVHLFSRWLTDAIQDED